jgi:hypothetical protein
MVVGRAVLPKSIAEDEAVLFSMIRVDKPYDARLAEGEEGEPETRDRRLVVWAAGAAGDSQKKDPSPGDPEKEAEPEKAGDCCIEGRREVGLGESTSMPKSLSLDVDEVERGNVLTGSV